MVLIYSGWNIHGLIHKTFYKFQAQNSSMLINWSWVYISIKQSACFIRSTILMKLYNLGPIMTQIQMRWLGDPDNLVIQDITWVWVWYHTLIYKIESLIFNKFEYLIWGIKTQINWHWFYIHSGIIFIDIVCKRKAEWADGQGRKYNLNFLYFIYGKFIVISMIADWPFWLPDEDIAHRLESSLSSTSAQKQREFISIAWEFLCMS